MNRHNNNYAFDRIQCIHNCIIAPQWFTPMKKVTEIVQEKSLALLLQIRVAACVSVKLSHTEWIHLPAPLMSEPKIDSFVGLSSSTNHITLYPLAIPSTVEKVSF